MYSQCGLVADGLGGQEALQADPAELLGLRRVATSRRPQTGQVSLLGAGTVQHRLQPVLQLGERLHVELRVPPRRRAVRAAGRHEQGGSPAGQTMRRAGVGGRRRHAEHALGAVRQQAGLPDRRVRRRAQHRGTAGLRTAET